MRDSLDYYLARKFLSRTHTRLFFFYFTRAITPRKAVPAHFSGERPLFSPLSILPSVTLLSPPPHPPSSSFLFSFSFCGTDLRTETRISTGRTRERRGARVSALSLLPLSKARPFVHGFPWKIELSDSQSNIYPDIIPPRVYMFARSIHL